MEFRVYDTAIPSEISVDDTPRLSREEYIVHSEGMARLIFTQVCNYAAIK